jgi:hypothetical protein
VPLPSSTAFEKYPSLREFHRNLLTFQLFSKFAKTQNIMNTIELKKNFHRLIDSIDNESLLMSFYDMIESRTKVKDGELWNHLDINEQEELLKAFEESENPDNVTDHEKIRQKHKKWL